MTIQQILDQLDTFTDADRQAKLGPLIDMLSGVSKQELLAYQTEHFATRTESNAWDEFRKGFDEKIRQCVGLEVSEVIGVPVRKALGLELITLETEVPGT